MTDKILRFLPKYYATSDENAALRHVIDTLQRRMREVERDLIRISLSHYVNFASGDVLERAVVEDLDKIGALYNIPRVIERVTPEANADEGRLLEEHRKLLERYRKRLKDTIQIFLGGLATARSIAHTVGAVFGLEIIDIVLPNQKKTIPLSGTAVEFETDAFTTAAFLQRPARDEDPFVLEIIDNPVRERVRKVIDQEASAPFKVEHKGLDGIHPQITIATGRDPEKEIGRFGDTRFGQVHFDFSVPLAFPVLRNITLGQMIVFNSIIPSETRLVIRFAEDQFSAFLDGHDVSEHLFFVAGSPLNQKRFGQSKFSMAIQNPRFLELQRGLFGRSQFNASVFSFLNPNSVLEPFLTPGTNEWQYLQLRERFDPLTGLNGLMGLLEAKTEILPREITFEWQERARAAFAVRLPRSIGFLVSDQERELFISTVNLVKAAGIEPIFDFQNIFSEKQDITDALAGIQRRSSPKTETHEQVDALTFSGLFGRTRFNTSSFHP